MTASRPLSLSNAPAKYPALDFDFLFAEGLRHIRRLAENAWTDHNAHDPGITILEQLCYALTDLAYRIDYDVQDLLTRQDGTLGEGVFSPAQLLTVNPVTLADIRKVVLDVAGVKNAWVEKVAQPVPEIFYNAGSHTLDLVADATGEAARLLIKGLYRVLVEQDEAFDARTVEAEVWARLQQCRSLCEDFVEVRVLPFQNIVLSGTIEVEPTADIDALAAELRFRVAGLIAPRIRFYTLQERLGSGFTPDEIFDGPVLQHGFIDDDELAAFRRKTEIHVSDIVREIMRLPGVKAVNGITLDDGQLLPRLWSLTLDPAKTPCLRWQTNKNSGTTASQNIDGLVFVQMGIAMRPDEGRVAELYRMRRATQHYEPLDLGRRDQVPQPGQYRNAGVYHSIQHHFPAVYGLGDFGLPESASAQRQAQVKQLKGYLLFFEQILADYFAQVGGLQDLVAFDAKPGAGLAYQALTGVVPGAEEVLQEKAADQPTGAGASAAAAFPNKTQHPERLNLFLNHLLARFGESLTDFSRVGTAAPVPLAPELTTQLLTAKLNFLRAYPQLSNERGKAFNHTAPGWDSANVSGLEKRVAAKLGIANWRRRSLSDAAGETFDEGFHLLEHVLLRPMASDADPVITALQPVSITAFEESEQPGTTVCRGATHELVKGDFVNIINADIYNGRRRVVQVKKEAFEIEVPYRKEADRPEKGPLAPAWTRTDVKTTLLALARQPITAFSPRAGSPQRTICRSAGHELEGGARIRIIGTERYNGTYIISRATRDTFEINQPYTGDEAGGGWVDDQFLPDPYSLQVSFVFPDWPPRFAGEFRTFAQQTIRAQTPAHIRVYVKWLSRGEMRNFEEAYQPFLKQLATKSDGKR